MPFYRDLLILVLFSGPQDTFVTEFRPKWLRKPPQDHLSKLFSFFVNYISHVLDISVI